MIMIIHEYDEWISFVKSSLIKTTCLDQLRCCASTSIELGGMSLLHCMARGMHGLGVCHAIYLLLSLTSSLEVIVIMSCHLLLLLSASN